MAKIKVVVYHNWAVMSSYECDSYEEVMETDPQEPEEIHPVLYITNNGKREKTVTLGDFGYGSWDYLVER